MCGLIGVMGDIDYNLKNTIFKDMLNVCATRGKDSTGVIAVKEDFSYTHAKMVGSPAYLYDSRQYERQIETGNNVAMIGHCRAKTVGEASFKNAHPFDFPDKGIIGVHNGTLRGYYHLPGYVSTKTDSETLYHAIAERGAENVFNDVTGAWACVWYDEDTQTVNFIRNKERPLFFAWSANFKQMFWASETWMFEAIGRKIALWEGDKKSSPYTELPLNTLWRFSINPKPVGKEPYIRLLSPKVIEPKVETNYYNNNNNRQGVWQNWGKESSGGYSALAGNYSKSGGEVANPFHKEEKGKEVVGHTQGNTTTKNLSEKSTNSAGIPSEKSKSIIPISSTKAYPNSQSSSSSLQTNNGKSFAVLTISSDNSEGSVTTVQVRKPPLASVREVAGLLYITDGRTGKEFTEEQFCLNTNAVCSFCKEPIGDLSEVGIFINDKEFHCNACSSAN